MRKLGRAGFYLLFAISAASVQLVGVYLVFASLMVPALATRRLRLTGSPRLRVGFVGYLAGLLLSAYFDLPTGAVVVWTLTLAGLAAAPLLARWRSSANGADPVVAANVGSET
jgi:zinc/manganese transport system permease protein